MKALQEAQGEKVVKVGDLKEQLGSAMKTERELRDLFDRVWDGNGQENEIARDIKETGANIKAHLVAHTWNDGKDGHVEMGLNHDENEKALQTTIDKVRATSAGRSSTVERIARSPCGHTKGARRAVDGERSHEDTNFRLRGQVQDGTAGKGKGHERKKEARGRQG